jgi:hypothetical protein
MTQETVVSSENEAPLAPVDQDVGKQKPAAISLANFLEAVPPSEIRNITALVATETGPYGKRPTDTLLTPEIELSCDECGGPRKFRALRGSGIAHITTEEFKTGYITYICSNCRKVTKTYALAAKRDLGKVTSGECWKFGEHPTFGSPTPARLISIIGPAKDLFLRGRRCENQGLGIGAFVYYRRVVEGQRDRIIENIIKVAERIEAPKEMIDILRSARAETRFDESIGLIRDAIPETLKIKGRNPLTLLHSALSDGLHGKSDEECLDRAHTIRLVLVELCDRIGQTLKDDRELSDAITRLLRTDEPQYEAAPKP